MFWRGLTLIPSLTRTRYIQAVRWLEEQSWGNVTPWSATPRTHHPAWGESATGSPNHNDHVPKPCARSYGYISVLQPRLCKSLFHLHVFWVFCFWLLVARRLADLAMDSCHAVFYSRLPLLSAFCILPWMIFKPSSIPPLLLWFGGIYDASVDNWPHLLPGADGWQLLPWRLNFTSRWDGSNFASGSGWLGSCWIQSGFLLVPLGCIHMEPLLPASPIISPEPVFIRQTAEFLAHVERVDGYLFTS